MHKRSKCHILVSWRRIVKTRLITLCILQNSFCCHTYTFNQCKLKDWDWVKRLYYLNSHPFDINCQKKRKKKKPLQVTLQAVIFWPNWMWCVVVNTLVKKQHNHKLSNGLQPEPLHLCWMIGRSSAIWMFRLFICDLQYVDVLMIQILTAIHKSCPCLLGTT